MVTVSDLPHLACCSWATGSPQCDYAKWKSGECHTKRELTLAKTPEGRKLWMAEYRDKCAAAARLDGCVSPGSVLQKLSKAGVPANLIFRVQNPNATPALEAARKWFDERPTQALTLSGSTGAGKSFSAAWACYRWGLKYPWNAGATGSSAWPLVWVRAWDISRVENWNDNHAMEILERASKASFLVVDDIGKESTKGGATALSDLLCCRLDNNRTTIITTNQSGSIFKTLYGQHLADRVKNNSMVFRTEDQSLRGVA